MKPRGGRRDGGAMALRFPRPWRLMEDIWVEPSLVRQYAAYIRTVVHVLYYHDVKTPSLIVARRRARRCS